MALANFSVHYILTLIGEFVWVMEYLSFGAKQRKNIAYIDVGLLRETEYKATVKFSAGTSCSVIFSCN